MLFVAIAEAGLAVLFFMHLWAEKRGFLMFVLVFYHFRDARHAVRLDRQQSDKIRKPRPVAVRSGFAIGRVE